MLNPINRVFLEEQTPLQGTAEKGKADGGSFLKMLKEGIQEVNQKQLESDQITRDFALGKIDSIHRVTIAAEEASLALNLTIAVQNKVIDAYKEIMRMQI